MRIVAAALTPVRLSLRHPLATAHGEIAAREGAVLELVDDGGHRGAGEALPLAGFGLETCQQARSALERLARAALSAAPSSLEERLDAAVREEPDAPCARAALDVALHDLAARRAALPLAAWLARRAGTAARREVATSRLLPARSPEAAAEEARAAVARGFRTVKLKLGRDDPDADLARVTAVRRAAGREVALRLDAGGAWSEDRALAAVERLAPQCIELLEQPVAADDRAALARVRAAAPFPIAADEAVGGEAAAEALLAERAADVLVLKPAALGGLRACGRIAARAREQGVACVVTSFLDSALGTRAALHLAASLPEEAGAAGLATSDLLAEDLASPPTLRAGRLGVPTGPGLGIRLEPWRLARVAAGATLELRG